MNLFNQYAVAFIFVIGCNLTHGINLNNYHWESMADVLTYDPSTYRIIYINGNDLVNVRRKRGFFSSLKIPFMESVNVDDGETTAERSIIASDTDVTTTNAIEKAATLTNIEAVYNSFMDMTQFSKVTHIVSIGTDVERSLVEAAPYLPLVNKVTKYIVPGLSLDDIVTLSLNVAVLVTNNIANKSLTKADDSPTISQRANGIYNKLKSVFGQVTNYFSDDEKTNSLAETQSVFDQVKNKIPIFGNFFDAPQTENKENQIETIVTQTYIEGSQPPKTNTIVTKTYESGAESLDQATDGELNYDIFNTKLENGKQKVDKIISQMQNVFISNENSVNESNDSDTEAYDDDGDDGNMNDDDDDDDDENMNDDDGDMNDDDGNMNDDDNNKINDDDKNTIDSNIVKKEDFYKVLQDSTVLQPDFIKTLDGEELLNHDELQKSLPNPNINNRKTFIALTEKLGINKHYTEDQVNKLIDALEKTTNYFILSEGMENNELLETPPTPEMI